MDLGFWQLELVRPLWLAVLAALPLLIVYWRWSLVEHSRAQRALSLVVRSLLLLLVVVALAGPTRNLPSQRQQMVPVIDDSLSIPTPKIFETVQAFRDEALRHPQVVADEGVFAGVEPQRLDFNDKTVKDRVRARQATDLGAAIASARAMIPADRVGQIVVFSDGNQTTGDALAAAQAAGLPVSTVPLASVQPETYVAAVHAPRYQRLGERFTLEAVIQANTAGEGAIEVLRGSESLVRETRHLTPGENRLEFSQVAVKGPSLQFTVKIGGFPDTLADNNQAGAVVVVGPKPRVLVVERQPQLAEHLAKALREAVIDVTVLPPQEMPATPEALASYDLLVLSNVPATSLPAERMEMIGQYVRDSAGGLIVVGGEQSLTAGGYHGTPLETALPVVCEVKREKPKPILAMVLVLDVSGSMQGNNIQLARQATQRAVEMLNPRDQIGILAFEDNSEWISPLHVANDKAAIMRQIETITAAGGTSMYPAMKKAFFALREADADLKHMIVMTDGVSSPGDFESLARQIAASGISVSTVGVGPEPARPLLNDIARRAKGHAYFCDDAAAVPQIFALETLSAARLGITEEPFYPQTATKTAPELADIDFTKAPTLLGYVETQPKPTAEVVLQTKAGEPLLARWRYGRGISAAFTSDIQSRWAAAWLRWPGFPRFWVQLARQTMRSGDLGEVLLDARHAQGQLAVTLDAVDRQGHGVNGAVATLRVTPPGGNPQPLTMPQVAPGRYGVTLPAATAGNYRMEATLQPAGAAAVTIERGVVVSYTDELRIVPTNDALLKAIAASTGGQFKPDLAELFAANGSTPPCPVRLWHYLLAAALGLLLVDVALKRVAWR